MYVTRFQVGNYKSFHEGVTLELHKGFNVITGPNNAGKTALLQALTTGFAPAPHRSPRTITSVGVQPDPSSWVDLTLTVEQSEFSSIFTPNEYWVPVPSEAYSISIRLSWPDPQRALWEHLMRQPALVFRGRFEHPGGWKSSTYPSLALYEGDGQPGTRRYVHYQVERGGAVRVVGLQNTTESNDFGVVRVLPQLVTLSYIFRAERFNAGMCPFGNSSVLAPNAANLPEILNNLQHNSERFRALNNLVSEVFPNIRWVSVRPGERRTC